MSLEIPRPGGDSLEPAPNVFQIEASEKHLDSISYICGTSALATPGYISAVEDMLRDGKTSTSAPVIQKTARYGSWYEFRGRFTYRHLAGSDSHTVEKSSRKGDEAVIITMPDTDDAPTMLEWSPSSHTLQGYTFKTSLGRISLADVLNAHEIGTADEGLNNELKACLVGARGLLAPHIDKLLFDCAIAFYPTFLRWFDVWGTVLDSSGLASHDPGSV
jgi:hypothetical protein